MGITAVLKVLIITAISSFLALFMASLFLVNAASESGKPSTILLWVICVAGVIAIFLLGTLAFNRVVEPLQKIEQAFKSALDKSDLTQRLAPEDETEIGQIFTHYNQLMHKMCSVFEQINETNLQLNDRVESVDTSAKSIARNSELQSDASCNMSDSAEYVAKGIADITIQSREASENTKISLEASELGTQNISQAVEGIRSISQAVERAADSIKSLRDDSKGISDMATVIHQIADQTNLLALNAAIEAARAGEQGRGFSVVADEVRSLAQRTSQSTTEISLLVEKVQKGAEDAVNNMEVAEDKVKDGVIHAEQAGESIEQINNGSRLVNTSVKDIFGAIQMQNEATEDIAKKIDQISHISEQNAKAASESASSIGHIAVTAQSINKALNAFNFITGSTKIRLRIADQLPDEHPAVRALQRVSENLKEKTNGRIAFSIYSDGKRGNDAEVFEQLKAGRLDMMRVNPALLNNTVPETNILTLPFLFKSVQHMHNAIDGQPGQKILDACQKEGLVGLGYFDSGSRSIYASKPIRSMQDMQGMKLRVMPSDLWQMVASAMGAVPAKIGMDEILSAKRMGVIDAAENNIPTFVSYKQYNEFSYFCETEHAMVPELILFSQQRWQTLSKEDQQLIAEEVKAAIPYMRKLWQETEYKAKQALRDKGVTLIDGVDKSAFQRAMEPIYTQVVTSPSMKAILHDIKNT